MPESIVSFLSKKTSKIKCLHGFLSKVYYKIIEPIKTGHAKRMLRYTFIVKRKEIRALKKYNLKNIRPYLKPFWRWGYGLDKAFRRYYRANFAGSPVFIKVSINDSTIYNEIQMAEYMKTQNLEFVVQTVKTDKNFLGNMQMLCISFAEGLHDLTPPKTKTEFEKYCSEFENILKKLSDNGIVHADIHPKNLMLDKNNSLVLLDFGISGIVNCKNDVNYIARCGTHYTENNNIRTYDDAYSFVKVIEQMQLPEEWLSSPHFLKIKESIGANQLRVSLKDGKIIL